MTDKIKSDEVYKTEALLQFALMRGDEEAAAELRAKLMALTGLAGMCECQSVWDGEN